MHSVRGKDICTLAHSCGTAHSPAPGTGRLHNEAAKFKRRQLAHDAEQVAPSSPLNSGSFSAGVITDTRPLSCRERRVEQKLTARWQRLAHAAILLCIVGVFFGQRYALKGREINLYVHAQHQGRPQERQLYGIKFHVLKADTSLHLPSDRWLRRFGLCILG